MAPGFIDVVIVAFTAQLAVLPGEKVQLIIAGLSTRYNPLVVVSAAGTAFAGWTALEIWFGGKLAEVLSPLVLDTLTAAMFIVFAVLLYVSIPEKGRGENKYRGDGGETESFETVDVSVPVIDRDIPPYLGGFVPIFVMMAFGEFGDKTQLITITLAGNYGPHPGIWMGEMLAIIPVSLLNAFFFYKFSHKFDVRKAHFAGAAIFGFFAFDTVLSITTGLSIWETIVAEISEIINEILYLLI